MIRTDSWLFGDGSPGGSYSASKKTDFFERCRLVDCHD